MSPLRASPSHSSSSIRCLPGLPSLPPFYVLPSLPSCPDSLTGETTPSSLLFSFLPKIFVVIEFKSLNLPISSLFLLPHHTFLSLLLSPSLFFTILFYLLLSSLIWVDYQIKSGMLAINSNQACPFCLPGRRLTQIIAGIWVNREKREGGRGRQEGKPRTEEEGGETIGEVQRDLELVRKTRSLSVIGEKKTEKKRFGKNFL